MRAHVATAMLVALASCAQPEAATPSIQPDPAHSATATPLAQPAVVRLVPSAAAHAAGGNAGVGPRRFGQPIGSDLPATTLAAIVAHPAQFNGHPIRVQGEVVAVCQEMGCWMEIRDQSTQAHIRMHGHSFFVPRDIGGHHANIEATLVAAHPATECDQEAHAATGRVAQVELDALGVEVVD